MIIRSSTISLAAAAFFALPATAAPGCAAVDEPIDGEKFRDVLEIVAAGWNAGDARLAADCFAPNAIYIEPPRKQVYEGREALFRFFGGDVGRAGEMSMTWRNIAFDEQSQIGAGEFTFAYGSAVHGVAIVKIENGLISGWREYWYESSLPWEEFTAPSKF